jgi:hypothetical protein
MWRARKHKRIGLTASLLKAARNALDETRQIEVTRQRIRVRQLASALNGFTIAQLSDIHHSAFVEADYIAHAVSLVNQLAPDLIVLTGDYVSHSRSYISGCAEVLGDLRARAGVYAVVGNHDLWTSASAIETAFRKRGIEMLRNTHTRVRTGGDEFTLIGIDDLTLGEDDLQAAVRGVGGKHPKVLLSHNPNIIWQAAEAQIDLVLSGHTHGGQINLPSWRRRARRFWPYLRGHGQLGQTQIYVNRGLGTVIVPVRFKCPPEITLIELKP